MRTIEEYTRARYAPFNPPERLIRALMGIEASNPQLPADVIRPSFERELTEKQLRIQEIKEEQRAKIAAEDALIPVYFGEVLNPSACCDAPVSDFGFCQLCGEHA